MPERLPEFRPSALLDRLVAGEVDFVVIGGFAALVQGASQLTRDLDICYSVDQPNLDRLGRTLIELEATLSGVTEDIPFVPDGRTLRRTQMLTLVTKAGRLDLLVDPAGSPGYAALSKRALRVEWAGTTIKIASLEDLIAMKRAAGRPKDLLAVDELEAIARILREG
ncbi:MAG: nucleotidyltransferase [Actinomycetota bacterium]|nr:nucleotidyltransferase [Actinomycetota bacterium]